MGSCWAHIWHRWIEWWRHHWSVPAPIVSSFLVSSSSLSVLCGNKYQTSVTSNSACSCQLLIPWQEFDIFCIDLTDARKCIFLPFFSPAPCQICQLICRLPVKSTDRKGGHVENLHHWKGRFGKRCSWRDNVKLKGKIHQKMRLSMDLSVSLLQLAKCANQDTDLKRPTAKLQAWKKHWQKRRTGWKWTLWK